MSTFDYGSTAGYFITLCTANRAHVLAHAHDDTMVLTEIGAIVQTEWLRSADLRPNLHLDAHVIMPDHVHFLFWLFRDAPSLVETPRRKRGCHGSQTVSSIIGTFKAAVTRCARTAGHWPHRPLWQTRFHDRIARDAAEAERIRKYVADNPRQWIERRRRHSACRERPSKAVWDETCLSGIPRVGRD